MPISPCMIWMNGEVLKLLGDDGEWEDRIASV